MRVVGARSEGGAIDKRKRGRNDEKRRTFRIVWYGVEV